MVTSPHGIAISSLILKIFDLCILLLIGHARSGIATLPALSLGTFAILPACLGIWIGFKVQDRINQHVFRIATLSVLVLAGINLIRRGIM